MNGKCIFRGKKIFAPALFAAAVLAAMFLLFGCGGGSASSGESYVSGDFGTGGNETGGGENTGNEGDDNGDENGNESGDGDEQSGNESGDENTTEKTVTQLLKEILTETEYDKIAGNVSSGNLTLTAQTIKAVGDTFSGLSTYKGKDKELETISDKDKENITEYKDAFVAQNENNINITKSGSTYKLNSYTNTIPVKFTGEFNLSEISLPDNNSNGNGDFSSATLTNNGENIYINKLNTIRGSSLPKLIFKNVRYDSKYIEETGGYVYDLYKAYSKYLDKLDIKGNLTGFAVDGKIISNDSTYTLLENDENTVKKSDNDTIKSLTIDAMVQMYKQLEIAYFVNMIISGNAETANVDWTLVNIVFEGDMSSITNAKNSDLRGIVYFKDKVYNTPGQSVYGLIKLDKLDGVSDGNFGVDLCEDSAVLDVRGVAKDSIEKHNTNILRKGGWAHAIYFSSDFNSIKDNQTAINVLCERFSYNQAVGFVNAYLGNTRFDGPHIKDGKKGADTPRSLKDFEYFGNNNKFMDKTTIAQNTKRIEFIDPETQKVLASAVSAPRWLV